MAAVEFLGPVYTANATDDVYIVRLEKNVPQRIRMFVWMEGQDADCVNSAEASSFAFRIELAGSHADVSTPNNTVQVPAQEAVLPQGQRNDPEIREEETEAEAVEPVDSTGENSGTEDESQSETINETEVEHEKQNE